MQMRNEPSDGVEDLSAFNRQFRIAVIIYVIIEALVIAFLMYLWLRH